MTLASAFWHPTSQSGSGAPVLDWVPLFWCRTGSGFCILFLFWYTRLTGYRTVRHSGIYKKTARRLTGLKTARPYFLRWKDNLHVHTTSRRQEYTLQVHIWLVVVLNINVLCGFDKLQVNACREKVSPALPSFAKIIMPTSFHGNPEGIHQLLWYMGEIFKKFKSERWLFFRPTVYLHTSQQKPILLVTQSL
jgi:hypothetical protein